jgi:hypothetical protein
MHQVGALRKIILILCFVLVFIGCVSYKPIYKNGVVELTAENVPEGVRLTLDHIPSKSNYIAFIFSTEGENAHSINTEFYYSNTDSEISLEEFKKAPTLICPFVQNGLNYTVTAYVKKDDSDFSIIYKATTEIIPNNVILFVPNGISLKLNEKKTGATFSAFPEFTREARYDIEAKYFIDYEIGCQPVEREFDSLVFDFSINLDEISVEFKPYKIKLYQRIKYDNIAWVLNFCEPVFFDTSL